MDAEVILGRLALVAARAGLGNPLFADARTGDHRLVHFVAAVTIHAIGGLHQAPLQGGAVHALVERRHKFRAHERPGADLGFLDVAGFAEIRLGQFAGDRQLVFGTAGHRQTVTVKAGRRFGQSGGECMTVSRGQELVVGGSMAAATRVNLPGAGEREFGRFHRCDGVSAVAGSTSGVLADGSR